MPATWRRCPNDAERRCSSCCCTRRSARVGIAAALFIRGLHWLEDAFDRFPAAISATCRHAARRHADVRAVRRLGHYFVEGVGYATIQAILPEQLTGGLLLLLLFVSKLLATSLSLARAHRAAFSRRRCSWARHWARCFAPAWSDLPGVPISLPAFAMVGMGAIGGRCPG